MPDPVLALDLGGTKIRAALVSGAGPVDAVARPMGKPPAGRPPRVERVATVATPATEGRAAILEAALALAESVRDGADIAAVGISSAGVIDATRGRVTHATGSLSGWAGTDLTGPFAARFAVPVSVLNDVHAHGIGEARFGVGRDRSSLLLIAVGTGIGGCHVLGGSAVLGSRGAAGHVGHLAVPEAEGVPCPCGRIGHLEGFASGPGIVQLARRLRAEALTPEEAIGTGPTGSDGSHRLDRRRGDVGPTSPAYADGHDLARAAHDGDPVALEAYRLAGFATGRVIGGLLNVLDAEAVALAGGVSDADGPWSDAVRQGIAHDAMDVVAATPVLPAEAGAHAALLGAAARAHDDLLAPPKGSPCIP